MGNNSALVRTVYGTKLLLNTNDIGIAPRLILDGVWEPEITNFCLKRIRKGMNILEVGSNIGWFTTLAGKKIGDNGHLYAFEANPNVIHYLTKNVEINGLKSIVTIIPKAAYNSDCKIQFNALKNHIGGSGIINYHPDHLKEWQDEVETFKIDAVKIDNLKEIKKIDFIKIDAEGSELFVMEGMQKLIKNNPNVEIVCEFFADNIRKSGTDPKDFLKKIEKEFGFNIYIITGSSKIKRIKTEELLERREAEIFLTKE